LAGLSEILDIVKMDVKWDNGQAKGYWERKGEEAKVSRVSKTG